MKLSKGFWALWVILLVLIADQGLKVWVKTNMVLYQSIHIADWFQLYFTENNGMAFGIEVVEKTFLSLFRMIASAAIGWYLYRIVKRKYPTGYVVCIALIFAGAVGNIIDCVFYGVVFDSSYGKLATLFPEGGGYATWLHGRVVDMFYFPIIRTTWPQWMPLWGGERFVFFSPVFNLADSAISVGVAILILFYRKVLSGSIEGKGQEEKAAADQGQPKPRGIN